MLTGYVLGVGLTAVWVGLTAIPGDEPFRHRGFAILVTAVLALLWPLTWSLAVIVALSDP